MSATDALERAGYERHWQNAHRLMRNDEVTNRIAELRSVVAAKHEVTAASLISEAEEVRQKALGSGQCAAAIAAIREKGVLSGQRVERSETGGPGDFAKLDDAAFAELMQNRLEQMLASLMVIEQS
jgi:hypothetical protein